MFRIMWFTTLGYAYYNARKWKSIDNGITLNSAVPWYWWIVAYSMIKIKLYCSTEVIYRSRISCHKSQRGELSFTNLVVNHRGEESRVEQVFLFTIPRHKLSTIDKPWTSMLQQTCLRINRYRIYVFIGLSTYNSALSWYLYRDIYVVRWSSLNTN